MTVFGIYLDQIAIADVIASIVLLVALAVFFVTAFGNIGGRLK